MVNINRYFDDEALDELQKIGISFNPEHDYSDEEMSEIYSDITDNFPYEFDADGEPKRMGQIFERIIDTFVQNLSI